ncbi:tyrosine-type recombinase/integrase [Lignipirellula cremea]|nr:site-specific integrase [Lignipirellula cremea]
MIEDVLNGRVALPDDADVISFLLTDGKLEQPVQVNQKSVAEVFEDYLASLPDGGLEENTLRTIKIHQNHLVRHLGKTPIKAISNLQEYVNARQKDKWRRTKGVGRETIKKELATLSTVWNWARDRGYVTAAFPKKVKLPKAAEKAPFQSWSEAEVTGQWESLYLDINQIGQLLEHVKASSPLFVYTMFVFAAHTGARRSEIIRSRPTDFRNGVVTIHEKKRVKGKASTRAVPMSPLFQEAAKAWLPNADDFTFPQSQLKGSLSDKQFKRAVKDSKWSVITGWHCLRHSFISNLASQGIDQRIIDEFVGHTSEEMRRRYRHLFPSIKRSAIDSVFGGEPRLEK